MYIDKLIYLLTKYTEEYEEKLNRYKTCETNISLFNELIPLLKHDYIFLEENKLFISILLSSIYSSDIESVFYNALYALKNGDDTLYFQLIGKINKDLKKYLNEKYELYSQIKNIEYLASSAKRVLPLLKHKLPIRGNTSNIKKIIAYYVGMGLINTKEEILLSNELYYYNKNVSKKGTNEEIKDMYEQIPNILNGGFEIFDEIDINPSKKDLINDYLKEIKGFIKSVSSTELITSLEKYQYNLDNNEYNYIINEVIKLFVSELLDYYTLFLDPSIFYDKDTREELINNYYQLLDKYTILRNYYHELTNIYEEDGDLVLDNNENILVFSHPTNKPTEARFIQDLKGVPFEYYEEALNLINGFIKNNIRLKKLTNNKNLRNAFELKGDQIRIIINHVKDNIYCILGIFTKKCDNDKKTYENIFNRNMIEIKDGILEKEIELGKITLKTFEELTHEKGRKGNR